jgi:hypothetical protein
VLVFLVFRRQMTRTSRSCVRKRDWKPAHGVSCQSAISHPRSCKGMVLLHTCTTNCKYFRQQNDILGRLTIIAFHAMISRILINSENAERNFKDCNPLKQACHIVHGQILRSGDGCIRHRSALFQYHRSAKGLIRFWSPLERAFSFSAELYVRRRFDRSLWIRAIDKLCGRALVHSHLRH